MKPIKTLMTSVAALAILAGPTLAQTTTSSDSELNLSAGVNNGQVTTDAQAQTQTDSDGTLKKKVENGADATADAAGKAGEAIKNGAQNTMEAAGNAADTAGEKMKEGASATASAVDKGMTKAGEKMEDTADKMAGNDLSPSTLTVGALLGADVMVGENDSIGEIDNVVVVNGKEMAVIGVGGFLGLGEHDVAVPLSDLSSDGSNVWAKGYSKDQLKQMAEFDADSATAVSNDEPVQLGAS
ncbi:hypothetical protein KM176_16795 [Pseudooceanicola sp. CBS1P-1]|uniref:PRC-barrel domain-containing protein n=1 Tax=Pseudooceanicola albus TaxID=2692189 RepID=A0A6L7G4K3_9RHOB|nr:MULTISPECIES: hypothetical protein [Pseudooceanicola]MBT9385533.1 hypothetical protein [Pseudooceanicola endophyticus]MXN19055.1 hypothetical protein [Pseudooceanicola albus]